MLQQRVRVAIDAAVVALAIEKVQTVALLLARLLLSVLELSEKDAAIAGLRRLPGDVEVKRPGPRPLFPPLDALPIAALSRIRNRDGTDAGRQHRQPRQEPHLPAELGRGIVVRRLLKPRLVRDVLEMVESGAHAAASTKKSPCL